VRWGYRKSALDCSCSGLQPTTRRNRSTAMEDEDPREESEGPSKENDLVSIRPHDRRLLSNKLQADLDKLRVRAAPIEYAGRRKAIVWVQPTLIAEIESSVDA
jgi:hypothetical protein